VAAFLDTHCHVHHLRNDIYPPLRNAVASLVYVPWFPTDRSARHDALRLAAWQSGLHASIVRVGTYPAPGMAASEANALFDALADTARNDVALAVAPVAGLGSVPHSHAAYPFGAGFRTLV